MNAFYPYQIKEETDKTLVLILSSTHWWANIFLYRLLPIFILGSVVSSFFFMLNDMPLWSILGGFLLSFIALILLKTKIIPQFSISADVCEIKTSSVLGSKTDMFSVQDIAYFESSINTLSKESGAFYYLILKNGKRVLMARFPVLLNNDLLKFETINEVIFKMTGLNVKEKSFEFTE
jgi:hypothetical protein